MGGTKQASLIVNSDYGQCSEHKLSVGAFDPIICSPKLTNLALVLVFYGA
jgi:hypothetical protein